MRLFKKIERIFKDVSELSSAQCDRAVEMSNFVACTRKEGLKAYRERDKIKNASRREFEIGGAVTCEMT